MDIGDIGGIMIQNMITMIRNDTTWLTAVLTVHLAGF